jgi:hypothetical protein
MTKIWREKLQRKKIKYFLDPKLQFSEFTYPQASIKDIQATEETFSPQKRTSSTEIS